MVAYEIMETGKISDGYHTFDELYDHRITLWIALCRMSVLGAEQTDFRGFPLAWRSLLHSDGTSFDGWFVLGMNYDPGDQITYHVPISRWDECSFSRTMDRAPEFDGHTSADVLQRIAAL